MEKQTIIQELHRLKDLWNKILPLTEKAFKVGISKGKATDIRNKESEKKYHYNSQIKIPNELSTFNAAEVESEIAYRHKQKCLKAAKKKLSVVRILLMIATIIGIVITTAPHILNIIGNELSAYDSFTSSIGFTLRDDMADFQNVISIVLAVFSAGSQALTVLLAGVAVSSMVKSKAYSRVPEIGKAHKGVWIAFMIVVGIFGMFTWVTVNPVGILALIPTFVLFPILKASVSKLEDSRCPVPTTDEAVRLDKARAEDAKNHSANEAARKDANAKERKAFEARQKKFVADCDAEIAGYAEQIEQLTDEIAALRKQADSEILSDKDNNLDTIERLLNYLENGRADTLKEALHMVDLDKEREKDREAQMQFAQMQAELNRQEARRYNDQRLAEQRAHNEHMQREYDRHNAQVEREQAEHNREMQREIDRLKDKLDS